MRRLPGKMVRMYRYSLFTAAQFLRRWFSVLTQTVTQTRKNQVELSVLETTKLRNFLSRKVRKCLEISAKNIRPTFGTKRPRVRIPTLRPPNQKPAIVEIAGFSLYINAISPFFQLPKTENSFYLLAHFFSSVKAIFVMKFVTKNALPRITRRRAFLISCG